MWFRKLLKNNYVVVVCGKSTTLLPLILNGLWRGWQFAASGRRPAQLAFSPPPISKTAMILKTLGNAISDPTKQMAYQ
jgi:hypothetical protein